MLLAGLSGLVSKGVSKVADGLQGLGEARAAGRKIRTLLHPATLTLEKIAGLFNWKVKYNTWLVVIFLSCVLVATRVLPWWQCDLLMKLAFGYRMFVSGGIVRYRGRSGRRGAVDVFWDTLPVAEIDPDVTATSPSRRSHQPSTVDEGRTQAGPATRPPRDTTPVVAQPHRPVPARPPPPASTASVVQPATGTQPPAAVAVPVQPAQPNPLVVKVATQPPLGSWSAIHVNTKKKGTLLILDMHVVILLPSATSPDSLAVEYGEVLSVSKKGSSMMGFALMLAIRDPSTGDTVTHRLQLKNRDAAYALLCERLGFPPAEGEEEKDKQV
jgi:hypothetical protein